MNNCIVHFPHTHLLWLVGLTSFVSGVSRPLYLAHEDVSVVLNTIDQFGIHQSLWLFSVFAFDCHAECPGRLSSLFILHRLWCAGRPPRCSHVQACKALFLPGLVWQILALERSPRFMDHGLSVFERLSAIVLCLMRKAAKKGLSLS